MPCSLASSVHSPNAQPPIRILEKTHARTDRSTKKGPRCENIQRNSATPHNNVRKEDAPEQLQQRDKQEQEEEEEENKEDEKNRAYTASELAEEGTEDNGFVLRVFACARAFIPVSQQCLYETQPRNDTSNYYEVHACQYLGRYNRTEQNRTDEQYSGCRLFHRCSMKLSIPCSDRRISPSIASAGWRV